MSLILLRLRLMMFRLFIAALELVRGPIRRYRIRQFWKRAPDGIGIRVQFNNWGGINYLERIPSGDDVDYDDWWNDPREIDARGGDVTCL